MSVPSSTEWDTTQLEEHRRAYLEAGLTFYEIAREILATLVVTSMAAKGYQMPPREAPKTASKARQCIFEIECSSMSCDLLYNAPDGLRGRYWQGRAEGDAASRFLIDQIAPSLVVHTASAPDELMETRDVQRSLNAGSAKIWPRERDAATSSLLVRQPLLVPRWAAHEDQMWTMTPVGGQLQIKGALVGPNGEEYVPEGKKDRSRQIHERGFT
jgi:hypothetical protein